MASWQDVYELGVRFGLGLLNRLSGNAPATPRYQGNVPAQTPANNRNITGFNYDDRSGEYIWRYGYSSWIQQIRWNYKTDQMWVTVRATGKEYGPTPLTFYQFQELANRTSKGKAVNAIWKSLRGTP